MVNIQVISAAFYPSEAAVNPFLLSCRRHKIPVRLYGVGLKWQNFCHNKVTLLLEELRVSTAKYVLYVDSNDTLFQTGIDGIAEAYSAVAHNGHSIVVSGDKRCWPHADFQRWFLARDPDAMFPFMCVGVFMGPRVALVNALKAVQNAWKTGRAQVKQKLQDDDQCWWMYEVRNGTIPAAIDGHGKLVASMHHVRKDEYRYGADGMHLSNGIRPCIVHFNGASKRQMVHANQD